MRRLILLAQLLVLAAVGCTEFPDAPSRTATLQPTGWNAVGVTDVETLSVQVPVTGGTTVVTGLRVRWHSSDDGILRVVQLQPAADGGREDTLAAQLRAEATGIAGGVATVSVTVDDGSFQPVEVHDTVRVLQKWVQVSVGYEHSCGVTVDSRAFCWGENDKQGVGGGFLGNGLTSGSSIPVGVLGNLPFRSVAAGDRHTCGLLVDGRVYCWGLNQYGAMGSGAAAGFDQLAPVPVALGRTFISIAAGAGFVCGITAEHSGFCWGRDEEGELGDAGYNTVLGPVPPFDNCSITGTLRCSLTPRPVEDASFGFLDLTAIGPGEQHTCGIRAGGSAVCWGDLPLLGLATDTTSVATPVQGGGQFRSVVSGLYHTCALQASDSTAYCWGDNTLGQLGASAQPASSQIPVPVDGGIKFQTLSAGQATTCGVAENARAYCWGSNQFGQLGTAVAVSSCAGVPCAFAPTPVQIPGDPAIMAVSVGPAHGCAVAVGGRAYCWGSGSGGKLGNAQTTNQVLPVRVAEPE